ncbi:MAG: PAS domain-containing protein, partial [Anaerolineales bacterium]|nr:PAS domain-containing protein [Anaerolineales bacterium]
GEFDGTPEGWSKYIYFEDLEKSRMNTQLAFTQNLLLNNEHRIIWPDGSIRYVATSAITVFAEDNTPDRVIGISIDITDRKKSEEALKLANAEMENALQVKDEFLANMSHELRTPLNAILGISESLEEQIIGKLNDKQFKYVGIIKESGRHLLELINDILDISKIEAGRMELDFHSIGVEKLCQASLRMIKEL